MNTWGNMNTDSASLYESKLQIPIFKRTKKYLVDIYNIVKLKLKE